ncbi:cation:proton antiporter [Streptomyces sp. NPDC001691]|uniref:cation:proton antiporter n=1 Tax=Streptomyces sp. NPDC001691 TaxID=3364600 RepID=UPI003678FCC6
METLRLLAHVLVVLVGILLVARVGRAVARVLGQPEVVGEIGVGLLSGPAVIVLFGRPGLDAVLPGPVFGVVKLVSQAGLVLFLVGLAHRLGAESGGPSRRGTLWVAAGALVPPLVTGLLLAGLVIVTDDRAARGGAPLPAFVLMVAVSMSITAVPVMARILAGRGMTRSAAGRTALAAAVVLDAVGWLLLTLAIGLGKGSPAGSLHSARALAFGAGCALAVRFALRTRIARTACVRAPRTAAVALGATALAVALAMERLGMTAILGAALVGFAIPRGENAPWERPVTSVARLGKALAPAFFVVTGITVLTGSFADTSWPLIVAAVVLGCAGKGIGGYAGARRGGLPPAAARRVAILMNTRGLTELVVLQAGLSSGILTGPLVLALIVMALTTTAMTGPLLGLLDRKESHLAIGALAVATEAVATEGGARGPNAP